MTYYNDHDGFACGWLRNLIDAGLIPPGEVDDRSITDVTADDVRGFRQAHFFCGIAGWPLALRVAGYPDDAPVWTGSVPCQPFSSAGKRKGTSDERHLWPEFRRLIEACRPPLIFGEQVASRDGKQWFGGFAGAAGGEPAEAAGDAEFAGVRADLEALGYEVGAADLCAACSAEEGEGWILYPSGVVIRERVGAGAPHVRQRLWWGACLVADDSQDGRRQWHPKLGGRDDGILAEGNGSRFADGSEPRPLDLAPRERDRPAEDAGSDRPSAGEGRQRVTGGSSAVGYMDNSTMCGRSGSDGTGIELQGLGARRDSSWSDFAAIPCTDGVSRRVESGSFPLAARIPAKLSDPRMGLLLAALAELGHSPAAAKRIVREARRNRVGRLRGYGNSIIPALAAEFIGEFIEASNP